MKVFISQEQVHSSLQQQCTPAVSGENYRFQKGSSRKYKRALKRKNQKPVKFFTIINNI